MIQRVQSIFLFLSTGALGSVFVFPFASSPDKTQEYFSDGIFNVHDDVILLGLIVTTVIACFVTIFLYSNRKLQLNLCLLSLFLIGGVFGMLIYSFSQLKDFTFDLGIASPILGFVMTILAYIFIKKDDKLVKSMDRLR
ncbi:MAG: DUF4293 domain-containing protein [Saprospiraceae bacterium]